MTYFKFSDFIKSLKTLFKKSYFKGDKYFCPICNSNLRALVPIGRDSVLYTELEIIGAGLRNAGCGVCGSTDKERLLYIYLVGLITKFKSENKSLKVLHVAPELAIKDLFKDQENIFYVAGDYFADGYEYPSDVISLNIEETKYDSNQFDLIICCHVLEHVYDDQKAINEIFRILNKNGKAILQVPISMVINDTIEISEKRSNLLNNHLYGQEDHLRLYGKDYLQNLKNAGFQVHCEMVNNDSNFGFNKNEFLIIAEKLD